jgi:hypothetical protein
VSVIDVRPRIELDVIERDSTPPALEAITPIDSVSLRVTFDKPLDPRMPLQPALIRIQRPDSSNIEVARVQWQGDYDRQRIARDSARRADSLKALPQPPAPAAPAPPVAAPPPSTRAAPPPPKPSSPAPERGVVVTIADPARFVPTETYRLTAPAMRNLVGRSAPATRSFTVPKPPPPKIVPDTAKRPPARPPASPPPKPPRSTG